MKIKPHLKEELKKYLLKKEQEEENKVVITSSYKMNDKELKHICNHFSELKDKKIEQIVDESLLAGVVIKHASKIRDLSLKHQLMNLQQRINEIA